VQRRGGAKPYLTPAGEHELVMARASVWGLGSALAYESLDTDAQARLLALYVAHRTREGEEAEGVVIGAITKFARAAIDGIDAAKEGDKPGKPAVSTGTSPRPPAVAAGKAQAGSRDVSLPDILRAKVSVADMLKL